jgi:hypothetical protein
LAKGSTSIWIDLVEWKKFQYNSKVLGTSANARIDKFIKKSNAEFEGKDYKPEVSLDSLKERRLKLMKQEANYFKLLTSETIENRTAYEVLCDFARIDTTMEVDIAKAYERCINHKWSRDDRFTSGQLETFIEYVEAVIERRDIEAKIREHRRRNRENSNA